VKVSEVSGGVVTTLRVRSASGSFQPAPAREEEVRLVRSAGQTLLVCRGSAQAVKGVTPSDVTQLTDMVVSGLPVLAYVAQAGDMLVIEARQFTQELRIAETTQFGLDDKVMEDLRRGYRVGGTATDMAAWLSDRMFLPPAPGEPAELRRLIISGDARGRLDAFRVHGLKVAADVRRIDNRLRIERVVRGGKGNGPRLILLSAPASIVDATLAAELHGAVRTTLSEAVAGEHSYLRTWQYYHQLESENVLRRARAFGSLEYARCDRRPDGGWRFHLAPVEDLKARLDSLGELDRFELEASKHPRQFDKDPPATSPVTRRVGREDKRLSASVIKIDDHGRFLDLVGPGEDDEQPRPPETGYLSLSTRGDEARLKRRERAEEALRTGNCPLPQLGLLMEGRPAPSARRGRVSVEGPKLSGVLREVFGATGPTHHQREAIEFALNTPDVCLIQGPPGTGKTKVITAIGRCLAVLADEGVEPSHRILVCAAQHDAVENVVQRTEVFGLPAVKVGRRRRGSDTGVDPAQVFADECAAKLRAQRRVLPEAERLSQARHIALASVRVRSLPADQARRIRDLVCVLGDLLPPNLGDRALERAASLERPRGAGEPEEAEKMLRAARGIRVDDVTFSDDGPVKARVALHRLSALLTTEERAFLERCAGVESGSVPAGLSEGGPLRESLIDRMSKPPPAAEPVRDEATERLFVDILDAVNRKMAGSRADEESVIAAYLHDLESDLGEVRRALEHYTVVLASTLQQAASGAMRRVRGIDEGQTTFESVIVDEAARANPLDLFIPLSMAARRVVLVGDHRQLPHLLEPDVERQLVEGVAQGTVEQQNLEAVQASLFERMWVLLRALTQRDSIHRTVTLDAQYRMHPVLGDYVSREFYEARNDGAIESPRPASEFAHDLPGYTKEGMPCVASWIDVPRERGREVRGMSKSRPAEADVIAREVRRLIAHDTRLTFGVIAFYSAQVDQIGEAMSRTGLTERTSNTGGWRISEDWSTTYNKEDKKVERLRIGTVDAFQGKEFDVVFLSVGRSNDLPGRTDKEQRQKFGHLMLENRLCVAMSRQQRLLVAVGDLDFVQAEDARQPLRALRAFTDLCGGPHGIVIR
jgi:hypothetical protein